MRSPLRTYEGQIRIFLGLLVLFLAVAIFLDVQLLMVARDAIREETGRRLLLECDLVRAELERDQMLRGLRAGPGEVPYIPPALLDRTARLKEMTRIEILTPEGRVLSASEPARVGSADPLLADPEGNARARLRSGGGVLAPLDRSAGPRHATLAAYRPIRDAGRSTIAVIRIETTVPVLAAVQFNLTLIAVVQAAGLLLLVVLVVLFARWLLQPYRRLLQAAGQTPGSVAGIAPAPATPEPDYLVDAFRGVLDKLRAQEEELHRLKGEPGADQGATLPGDRLIAGMSSAVLVFDGGGRLAVLNAAAGRILGLERGEPAGRPYAELLQRAPRLVDLVGRSLGSGASFSREVIALPVGAGREAHLGAMVSPIRTGGGPIEGVLCLLADLTEIKVLRERVGLKENLAALGEMSAGIAHEFRNSLAAIQGLARLIQKEAERGGGATGVRESADAIVKEVAAVGQVVQDFLRFARPLTPEPAEVDLRALTEDLARDFRGDPAHAGVRLEVVGEFPPLVADPTLLRQAVLNLLANAAEAVGTKGDGGNGSGRDPRIVVRVGRDPDDRESVRIAVEDNGRGIPPGDLARIFTPFFTTKAEGTGLGLALVQKTAVVHDGRVEVASLPGEGTRFTLILPHRPGAATLPSL
ncbi:MAG: sensor histidine kinase [Candidatus Polarisedimenticolia bacterium]